MKRAAAIFLLAAVILGIRAAPGWAAEVIGWGADYSTNASGVPADLSNVTAIAAGGFHALALRADGTVTGWGDNTDGQLSIPPDATSVVAIAAGFFHSLALKSDGSILAWGSGYAGLTNLPPGLTGAVAIAAGGFHNLALTANGRITAWGEDSAGQLNMPDTLTRATAIAAGGLHSVALQPDGTVVAWGDNLSAGQLAVPVGLTGVVAVAAGFYHSLALKHDGTVVAWGGNAEGQCAVPSGLTGVVAIAAGCYHSVALSSDGRVVAWGSDLGPGETLVPANTDPGLAVAGGDGFSLALLNTFGAGAAPLVLAPRRALGATLSTLRLRVAAKGQAVLFGATGLPTGLSINQYSGVISGTPATTGVYAATIAASNGNGHSEAVITLHILDGSQPPAGGFASWGVLESLPEDRRGEADINGPLGLPNLLAYGMGVNPLLATATDLPYLLICPGLAECMRFRYLQNPSATGVRLGPFASHDLREWRPASIFTTNTLVVSNGWQLIEALVGVPGSNTYFLRLSAWSTNETAQ